MSNPAIKEDRNFTAFREHIKSDTSNGGAGACTLEKSEAAEILKAVCKERGIALSFGLCLPGYYVLYFRDRNLILVDQYANDGHIAEFYTKEFPDNKAGAFEGKRQDRARRKAIVKRE